MRASLSDAPSVTDAVPPETMRALRSAATNVSAPPSFPRRKSGKGETGNENAPCSGKARGLFMKSTTDSSAPCGSTSATGGALRPASTSGSQPHTAATGRPKPSSKT